MLYSQIMCKDCVIRSRKSNARAPIISGDFLRRIKTIYYYDNKSINYQCLLPSVGEMFASAEKYEDVLRRYPTQLFLTAKAPLKTFS